VADRSYIARNEAARARLRSVASGLTEEHARRELGDGWTVGGLLAHLAFWDTMVAGRWAKAVRDGEMTPMELADGTQDLVNDALVPVWCALGAREVEALVIAASETVDAAVEALPDAAVDAVLAEGRARLLDRSLHRTEHLDAIG
jgi:hypothetical protein